jgi:hypothetical protein
MARFKLEMTITEETGDEWERIRELVAMGRSVELVARTVDGKPVIEVRRWTSHRDDDSNHKTADPDTDYRCSGRGGDPSDEVD